jgi:putative NADH-flavin reductase
MRLALLGASGRIGRHVLAWALESGHQVTALARNPESLAAAAGLTVITGDATEAASVARLVTGADAVLSALGPRGAKSPALMARAGENTAIRHSRTDRQTSLRGAASPGAVGKHLVADVLDAA